MQSARSSSSSATSSSAHRRAGVDRRARPSSRLRGCLQRVVEVGGGLGVDRDAVGAGPRELGRPGARGARSSGARRGSRRPRGPASAIASTISGPIVIGGTKWPSITSTWITRAPAVHHLATCSPRRAKSADRIDGAIRARAAARGSASAAACGPSLDRLSIAALQWLQVTIAVLDMRTIVECSPQLGQTRRSS